MTDPSRVPGPAPSRKPHFSVFRISYDVSFKRNAAEISANINFLREEQEIADSLAGRICFYYEDSIAPARAAPDAEMRRSGIARSPT
jgi:hypothetical protein